MAIFLKKMADLHITENLKVKELFFLRPLLKKKKKKNPKIVFLKERKS